MIGREFYCALAGRMTASEEASLSPLVGQSFCDCSATKGTGVLSASAERRCLLESHRDRLQ